MVVSPGAQTPPTYSVRFRLSATVSDTSDLTDVVAHFEGEAFIGVSRVSISVPLPSLYSSTVVDVAVVRFLRVPA